MGGRGFMLASFRVVENYEVDEDKKIKNRFSWFPLFPIQSKYDSHMRNMIPLLNFHPPHPFSPEIFRLRSVYGGFSWFMK